MHWHSVVGNFVVVFTVYRSLITRYRQIRLHFHFSLFCLTFLLVCNINDCHLNEFEIVKLQLQCKSLYLNPSKMVICAAFDTTLHYTMEFIAEKKPFELFTPLMVTRIGTGCRHCCKLQIRFYFVFAFAFAFRQF